MVRGIFFTGQYLSGVFNDYIRCLFLQLDRLRSNQSQGSRKKAPPHFIFQFTQIT